MDRARFTEKRRSSFVSFRIGNFRTMTARQPRPEISWLTAVATAAPATSMPQTMIRKRSSTMFTREANTRNTTGVLLSPRERRMPLAILYRTQQGMAAKMIRI